VNRVLVLLVLGCILVSAPAQEDTSADTALASVLKSSLCFRPLVAAVFEPRIGFQFQPSLERLRLDIGFSADVLNTSLARDEASADDARLALGVDAFTYSRLRSEANLKFPVEMVDYMFGINASSRWRLDGRMLSARVRLAHISAHLADGFADSTGMLRQRPFIYSREFLDAIVAHEWLAMNVRVYGGGTVLLTVKELPTPVSRIIPQFGVEWSGRLGVPVVAGYDVRIVGIGGVTQAVHAAQFGAVVLDRSTGRVALCSYYYAGFSMHGMWFDRRDQYWAFGTQVLF